MTYILPLPARIAVADKVDKRGYSVSRSDIPALALLAVAITIYFSKIIFLKQNFFIGDMYTQYYPWKAFAAHSLNTGSVPFWNPTVFSGIPFLADIQKGIFYPPGIFFLIMDFSAALKLYILGHFIFAGVCIYILLRSFGFSQLASFGGAVVFIFNSFTAAKINNPAALGSFAVMPAAVYSLKRLSETGKITYFLMFCFLTALSFLSGHYPTFITSLFFMLLFFIFYLVPRTSIKDTAAYLIKSALFLAAACAVFTAITMPQTGLFHDLVNNSLFAGGSDYGTAASGSMSYRGLLGFLAPGAGSKDFIQGWSNYSLGINNYFSATFIFLFIISIFYKKDKLYFFSVSMCLFALLLSMGSNTPVHSLLYTFMPFIIPVKFPGFAMTLFILPAAAITARGLDALLSSGLPDKESFHIKLSWLMRASLFLMSLPFLTVVFHENIMKVYRLDADFIIALFQGLVFFTVIFLLNTALYVLKEKNIIKPAVFASLAAALIFFELFIFMIRTNPLSDSRVYYPRESTPETAKLMRTSTYKFGHLLEAASNSIYDLSYITRSKQNFIMSVPSNTGLVYGLYDSFGYNELRLKNYAEFTKNVLLPGGNVNGDKLNLLNIKYIIYPGQLDTALYPKIFDVNGVRIYKNSGALPMFFITKDLTKPDITISQLSWSRKTEYDFGSCRVNVNIKDPGYLIYCNNFYPGWKAYVDNRSVPMEKCFGLYLGVKLEPGLHDILLTYAPLNLSLYLLLMWLGFIVVIPLGVVKLLSFRK
jgi:hypothetical protein